MSSDPARWPEWLATVLFAWGFTGAVLLASVPLSKRLGRRGLVAIERLTGMVLVSISVKTVLTGVAAFFGLARVRPDAPRLQPARRRPPLRPRL